MPSSLRRPTPDPWKRVRPLEVHDRVAVFVSRDWTDLEAVRAFVRRRPAGTVFLLRGLGAADQLLKDEATARGDVRVEVYRPDRKNFETRAPEMRDFKMTCEATEVVFFGTCPAIVRREAEVRRVPVARGAARL